MTSPERRDGLPDAARDRIAAIKASGTWGSALSVDEFAAIKSVGFEPVGQVFGAAVFNIGYAGGTTCPTYSDSYGFRSTGTGLSARLQPYTQVSSYGSLAAFGPLAEASYAARRAAIGRMSAECAALDGHGVVGVTLSVEDFPGGGVQLTVIGTAVRAPGAARLREPFSCDVSGQGFAKLIMAGVVPVSLVFGISIGVRHDDGVTRGQSNSMWNVEVSGYTDLVNRTRQDARNELMLDVIRVHAEGVVLGRMDMRTGEHKCRGLDGAHDHWAEVTMTGTSIARFDFDRPVARRPSVLALSLNDERRPR